MASRKNPFEDIASPALIPLRVGQGERDEIPADCPPKLGSLITFCWHQEPDKRPSAVEIVEYLNSPTPTYSPASSNASASAVTKRVS